MEQSPSINNLTKALLLFQVKVDTIKFDSDNPFFRSKYASLTQILQKIKDPLIESGLVVSQFPIGKDGLVTMLIHAESGEYIRTTYYMQPEKETPQAHGSVVTYQRRYCIQSILNLNFDNDDDANAASPSNNPNPDPAKASKESKASKEKQWLNKGTDMFDKAIAKLKDGTTTIDKIKAAFKVNKEVMQYLLAASNESETNKS